MIDAKLTKSYNYQEAPIIMRQKKDHLKMFSLLKLLKSSVPAVELRYSKNQGRIEKTGFDRI